MVPIVSNMAQPREKLHIGQSNNRRSIARVMNRNDGPGRVTALAISQIARHIIFALRLLRGQRGLIKSASLRMIIN